jgi:hypothetical protein
MAGAQQVSGAPPLPPTSPTPTSRLTPWETGALVAFGIVFLLFGGLVEVRSAFLSRRMGDLDCYLRAAWAVRSGADLYAVTDDNGFHYNYPPLLAVLLAPLADPPAGVDRAGMPPFAVSVGLWYAFSLVCLALAVHWLAGALEAARGQTPSPGDRRWWALRLWPVLACLIPIGHSLMRGQVNLLVLALLCAAAAAVLRGRPFRGGLCLAGAVCIKIIPAFLLLFPLWRRDGRFLAGCAAGMTVGLGLVPLAALGPSRTWTCYRELYAVLIEPALGVGTDQTRADELTTVKATDSQSFLAVFHNTQYPTYSARPSQPSGGVRRASEVLSGTLTLLLLLTAGWRRSRDPLAVVLLWGGLILNMLFLSPVCHLHYFSLAVPLVMALLAARWERRGTLAPGPGLIALFAFGTVANLLPHLPGLNVLRDGGLALYAALALWLVGVVALWRRRRTPTALSVAGPGAVRGAAA